MTKIDPVLDRQLLKFITCPRLTSKKNLYPSCSRYLNKKHGKHKIDHNNRLLAWMFVSSVFCCAFSKIWNLKSLKPDRENYIADQWRKAVIDIRYCLAPIGNHHVILIAAYCHSKQQSSIVHRYLSQTFFINNKGIRKLMFFVLLFNFWKCLGFSLVSGWVPLIPNARMAIESTPGILMTFLVKAANGTPCCKL